MIVRGEFGTIGTSCVGELLFCTIPALPELTYLKAEELRPLIALLEAAQEELDQAQP